MAAAPMSENENHYCSDPNCSYCEDLRLATEQSRRESALGHDLNGSAHQE